MNRCFKLATLVSAIMLTAAPAAFAGIPDCNLSVIPNVVAVPDSSMPTTMTIVSSSGPLANALVEIRYSAQGNSGACFCTSQPHPSVFEVTNGSGQATFMIAGGGCLDPATIAGGVAIQVYVNNILCKQIGQVSPDVINTTSPPCLVSLGDAVSFTGPLATATYGFCYDLNSDLAVGLTDAVLFTPPTAAAASCP